MNYEKLLRIFIESVIKHDILSEKRKPGGGITQFGAKKILDPSGAAHELKSAVSDAEGDVPSAADKLGISVRRMYDLIQDTPSVEKIKDSFDDEEKSRNENKTITAKRKKKRK